MVYFTPMDENISDNPQSAYALAKFYRDEGNNVNAEEFAIKAMELGCEKEAPQLLAEIALKTQSKSTAITLSSYYWEKENVSQAKKWATFAEKFGSKTLAPKRLDEIQAHKEALILQEVVENFSPAADEKRDDCHCEGAVATSNLPLQIKTKFHYK